MDWECTDSGEFVPTATPDRVLAVFETVEGPVITSGDAASELTARQRRQAEIEYESFLPSLFSFSRVKRSPC